MTPPQTTTPDPAQQHPARWSRVDVAAAFDHFGSPNPSSQRQYAREQDIPRSTLGHWMRRDDPCDDDPIAAFCHSTAGQSFLQAIVVAALTTFSLRGACGIRLVGVFLRDSGLDRFVGPSRGALYPLLVALESQLAAFDEQERPRLAALMPRRSVTAALDEHFHAATPCLVAIEPVSNFILVECYRDRRDALTWKEALVEGTRGMDLDLVLITSDLARGLIRCAEKGLGVMHSPDLFHGQRDLLRSLLLPLNRPVRQAEKELEKAAARTARLDCLAGTPQPQVEELALIASVRAELAIEGRLEQARQCRETALQGVRGLGDDYHPFDRHTGKPVTAQEAQTRLSAHLDRAGKAAEESDLGERAGQGIDKARAWVTALVGCVAWFWGVVSARLEGLDLAETQEREVREALLPGHYWEKAARRARTSAERRRLRGLAEELKRGAWREGGALASLPAEQKAEVSRVAKECAGLFSRSSSCVEGRNGRLSLHHHGHGKVSAARLTALRVIHNYMARRDDGTTAAERFFGQGHEDVFAWLLRRMPDLPRPAAKRQEAARQAG
jgi:hypothetical protein